MAGSSIASLLVPALFIAFGATLVTFRAQISRWYRDVYRNGRGNRRTRIERSFSSGTMVGVGSFAIVVGAIFLILNIARLI